MSYRRKGFGYAGTDSVKTTTENMQEIVDLKLTQTKVSNIKSFYKFDLDNKTNCTIFVNENPNGIYLEAGDGFKTDSDDEEIYSIKIKESGTQYKWMGHY